jgi:hypothetical protein
MRPKLATRLLFACFSFTLATCAPAQHIATPDEALVAREDVWGEAALKQPGGPSYEFFVKLLPPLRYVDANFHVYPITLSAPRQPAKARLVSNGSCVNALARQATWRGETGIPVTFFVGDQREVFGSDLAHLDGPRYVDGYLPIVQLTYTARGATYSEEMFASTDPELAENGVVLVKLTLNKASGRNWRVKTGGDNDSASTAPVPGVEGAENLLVLAKDFDEKVEALVEGPELYTLKGNRILSDEGKQVVVMFYPRPIFNPGRGAMIAPLMTGESTYFAIFTKPAAAASVKFTLTPETYEAQRKGCAKTWNDLLNRGTVVETPEAVVNNAWRSEIIGNYELISGNEMRYSQGNQYAKRYIGEGGDAIRTHALWGQSEDAKSMIPAQFAYTRAGLEFHQAAFKLQMLAHYYSLTKDAAFVREIRPMWQKEIDVIVKGRQTENGMFPREKYCGDIDTRVYSLNSNANCWRALRDISGVLSEIGDTEQSQKLATIASEWRNILLDAIDKATQRDVDPPFVPIALSGEERPHDPIWGTTIGSYWNLMIEYVLGSGVFTADSRTATNILRYLQTRGGLCMGMLRARATPGNFWVYGGRINDLYGTRYALTLLQRDEADRALVSFYGKLAQGMTRDTFIGCEGSSIGAVDEFGRQMALPPNSAANANYLQQLRYILVQDWDLDDDGQPETLRLLFATPRTWLADGKTIRVERAPTAFGDVSVRATSNINRGQVSVDVSLPQREAAKKTLLRLRLPEGYRLVKAGTGARELGKTDRETLDLTGLAGQVQIFATVEPAK